MITANKGRSARTFGLVSRDQGCRVDLERILRIVCDINAFLYVGNRIVACPEYQATDFSFWRARCAFEHLRMQRS